jgi:hypothetical protein
MKRELNISRQSPAFGVLTTISAEYSSVPALILASVLYEYNPRESYWYGELRPFIVSSRSC